MMTTALPMYFQGLDSRRVFLAEEGWISRDVAQSIPPQYYEHLNPTGPWLCPEQDTLTPLTTS